MGVFSISPYELAASGKKLSDNAESFATNSENIFKAVDEMIRARTLCAKSNAVLPDDPTCIGYLEELFGHPR